MTVNSDLGFGRPFNVWALFLSDRHRAQSPKSTPVDKNCWVFTMGGLLAVSLRVLDRAMLRGYDQVDGGPH